MYFILSHKGKAENFGKAVAHQNYISVNLTFSQSCNDDDEDYFTLKHKEEICFVVDKSFEQDCNFSNLTNI